MSTRAPAAGSPQAFVAIGRCLECDGGRVCDTRYPWWERQQRVRSWRAAHQHHTGHVVVDYLEDLDGERLHWHPMDVLVDLEAGLPPGLEGDLS